MDGCFGLRMKVLGTLVALVLLSGCGCVTDTQDKSDVPEYFSGCWSKIERSKK